MFPILQIGGLAIQAPGLILLAGIWLGLNLAEKHAKQHKIHPEMLYNLVFAGIVSGIVGARLTYVGRYLEQFADSPASLISLNPGLLDITGGVAAALIASIIYIQRKQLNTAALLDALTPFFAVLMIAIPLANLSSGKGFGAPTTQPWAIALWGAMRHPSQIYELILASTVLLVFWPSKFNFRNITPGLFFLQFVTVSAFVRVWTEGFRGDSIVFGSGLRYIQIAALLITIFGLWLLWRQAREVTEKD